MQGLEETSPLAAFETLPETPSGDSETGSPVSPKGPWWFMEWNGCLLPAHAVHSSAFAFKDSTHVLS